jgi:hypothetical protein
LLTLGIDLEIYSFGLFEVNMMVLSCLRVEKVM